MKHLRALRLVFLQQSTNAKIGWPIRMARSSLIFMAAIVNTLALNSGGDYVQKRQSEVADLNQKNDVKLRHNAIEAKDLVGFNKTGALTARTLVGRYYPETPPLPVSIEVKEGSALVGEPGRLSTITFLVTSNLPYPNTFQFIAEDTGQYLVRNSPEPIQATISGGNTVQARVTLQPGQGRDSGKSTVSFYVLWDNHRQNVRKKAYFYVGTESYDSYSPEIWYEFDGDCSGSVSPKNCEAKNWKATISIRDSDSGLLSVRSDPLGLILEQEFIVGTKDTIRGYYTSSCCQTKVDITARDVLGNERTKYIDIERRWLSAGEIAAIVLACILFIIIVAFIVWLIVLCCRRRKATLSIYPSQSRRGDLS